MSRPREPHGADWQEAPRGTVAICPICCDSHLDDQELVNPFCACGYQMCSFCLNRIQTEADNTCPHCRTSYQEDPQNELRERLRQLAEQRQHQHHQPSFKPPPPPGHRKMTASPQVTHPASRMHQYAKAAIPPPVLEIPRNRAPPASPERNLEITKEELWPGLSQPRPPSSMRERPHHSTAAASPRAAKGGAPPATQQPPPPQQQQPVHLPLHSSHAHALWPQQPSLSQPRTPPYGHAHVGGSTATSTAPTAAETPPSPIDTVMVSYHGSFPPGHAEPFAQGRCSVSLRGQGMMEEPGIDLEGAALVSSLQEAIRGGRLSVQAAAAAVMRRLEAKDAARPTSPRQQAEAAASVGESLRSTFRMQQQHSEQHQPQRGRAWCRDPDGSISVPFESGGMGMGVPTTTSLFSGWGDGILLGSAGGHAPAMLPQGGEQGGSERDDRGSSLRSLLSGASISQNGSRAPPPGFGGNSHRDRSALPLQGSTLVSHSRFG